jgi:AcrR family transcriptional regulator
METTHSKNRIKDKAHDLMNNLGVRSVSMDDIAASLGMSKKTIYQFFEDKETLVSEIITEKIDHNQQCCIDDKINSRDAVHEIFLAMHRMQEMFENMNPIVLHDLEKFHPNVFKIIQHHKYTFLYDVLKKNMERGIKEELYRSDLHIETIVKSRIEQIMLAFNQQVFPKAMFRLADVENRLTEHFLFGIASLKGHKLILKYQKERQKTTK